MSRPRPVSHAEILRQIIAAPAGFALIVPWQPLTRRTTVTYAYWPVSNEPDVYPTPSRAIIDAHRFGHRGIRLMDAEAESGGIDLYFADRLDPPRKEQA